MAEPSDADDDSNVNEFAEVVEGDHFDDFDMAAISATSGDNQMMYDNPISDQIDRTELMRTFLMELNQSSIGTDSTYMAPSFNETIPTPPNYVKIVSVFMCNVFGCLCLLLNLFVIFALLRNRRRVLRNVFYVLVLHCAIVDLIRGTCLIAWGMPHLIINNMHSMRHRLLALKINQFTLVILRSCNLLTIFNLLVFTTNEFIVIKYPLHYRRCFRRRTVLCILGASWIISLFFGIGSVFSNFFESAHSVMVLSSQAYMFRNASGVPPTGVTRRELAGVSINVVFMLIIFVLCYLCLLTVLICYGTILRTIRRFHGGDDKGRFHSDESQKITKNSIYCRHDDSTKTNASSTFGGDGTTTNANGPVDHNVSKRCSSHRKWRSHLMSRHKYLIVIGSVLFVDVLFLFPYSGIQMVAFLHLNNMLSTSPMSTMIRWGLQILIGIHSVMQPLCYFRMNEFRRLACCGNSKQMNRSKSFSQTKDQLATNDDEIIALRDNQSRELVCEPLINARGDAAESDDEVPVAVTPSPIVIVNSPNRSQMATALPSTKMEMQFLEHNWNRVGSSKFRRHGPPSRDEEDGPTQKLSTYSGLRSSTCFEEGSFFENSHH